MQADTFLPYELKLFVEHDDTYTDRFKACLVHFFNYMYKKHVCCPIKRNHKGYAGICVNSKIGDFFYKQERVNNKRQRIFYKILEYLTDKGLISKVKQKNGKYYSVGTKSTHYTLSQRAFDDIHKIDLTDNKPVNKYFVKLNPDAVFYTINTSRISSKKVKIVKTSDDVITMDIVDKPANDNAPVINRTRDIILNIYNTMIDRANFCADVVHIDKQKAVRQINSLRSFRDNSFCSISPTTGRLFSNFTALERGVREQYLNYKWSIDVKNAQFVFLCVLMKGEMTHISESTSKFIKLCADGQLYEHMMNILGKDREYVKKWMYRLAFDSKLAKYEKWGTLGTKELFKNEFPDVFDYIKTFQKNHGITIVNALQQIESDIFVEKLLKPLVGKYEVVSLHDSIYSFDDKLSIDVVEQKLIKICNEFNIHCTIHKNIKKSI